MRAGVPIRRAAKVVVLPAGFFGRRRAGDLVILLYHRVGPGTDAVDLPAAAFEAQMARLAATELPVTLDSGLTGGGVVVSFDDGSPDFYDTVLPVITRFRVPVILYLATSLVEGADGAPTKALSWSHIKEAVSTGLVQVGSHSHHHIDLSRADANICEEEMRRSKETIEERLGVACRHFAYPYAVGSAVAEREARKIFDSAALHPWGINRKDRIDPYRLARIPVLANDTDLFFRAKVRGLLEGPSAVYRALQRGRAKKM